MRPGGRDLGRAGVRAVHTASTSRGCGNLSVSAKVRESRDASDQVTVRWELALIRCVWEEHGMCSLRDGAAGTDGPGRAGRVSAFLGSAVRRTSHTRWHQGKAFPEIMQASQDLGLYSEGSEKVLIRGET